MSKKFAESEMEFALDLFKQLGNVGGLHENFVFSPFSIQCCLALAFAGSSGQTAQQLVNGLKLISEKPAEVAEAFKSVLKQLNKSNLLKIGNKIYVNDKQKLNADYELSVKSQYLAEAENINFAENVKAAATINTWVSECTAGKITNLISADALNDLTGLVLLNAIHFKGLWQQKFDSENTKEGEFWINEKDFVNVPFMNKKAKFNYGYFEDLKCSALEMPYKDSDLSMLILLPDVINGLKDLIGKMKYDDFVKLSENMQREEIIVKFPKFKVEFSLELKETLQKVNN